jgi:hypothetical protein
MMVGSDNGNPPNKICAKADPQSIIGRMATKNNPPSVRGTAFDCPHCGAYAAQSWYALFAEPRNSPPILETMKKLEETANDKTVTPEAKRMEFKRIEKAISGLVFLEFDRHQPVSQKVTNLHLSQCYSCKEFSVWRHEHLVFPVAGEGPSPNEDLPLGVRGDYEEANQILKVSPRGSAALLRLAIQKLCVELGEKGENINDDIASLVKKGLAPMVQQALDAVRVIGNEAVHPGTVDLKDDIESATQLFRLVNIIAEQMISNPRHVKEIYDKLPESKRKAIEARDVK